MSHISLAIALHKLPPAPAAPTAQSRNATKDQSANAPIPRRVFHLASDRKTHAQLEQHTDTQRLTRLDSPDLHDLRDDGDATTQTKPPQTAFRSRMNGARTHTRSPRTIETRARAVPLHAEFGGRALTDTGMWVWERACVVQVVGSTCARRRQSTGECAIAPNARQRRSASGNSNGIKSICYWDEIHKYKNGRKHQIWFLPPEFDILLRNVPKITIKYLLPIYLWTFYTFYTYMLHNLLDSIQFW